MNEAPFQKHSATSRAAAQHAQPRAQNLRDKALGIFRTHGAPLGGLTDEELITIMRLPANTVRPRRVELMQAGLIKQVGTRKTASGRSAVVWGLNA